MIALPAAQQLKKEFASNRINILAALTIFLTEIGENPNLKTMRLKSCATYNLHSIQKLSIRLITPFHQFIDIVFLQPWVGARRYWGSFWSHLSRISLFAKEHLFALINMLYRNEGIITTLPIWCAHWRPLASFLQWLVHSFWWLDWFIKLFSWDRFETGNGRFLRRFYGRWCRKLINT